MMKSRFALVIFLLLGISGTFTGIVYADEAPPVITHVYFEKDGVPYTEPVHYTVSCYINNQNTASDRRAQYGKGGTGDLFQVFSYSATCTGYGCPVYEPYYRVKLMKMDR